MTLNYHFNHVKRCFVSAKMVLIKKEQFPIRFLSGENYFGAVALMMVEVSFFKQKFFNNPLSLFFNYFCLGTKTKADYGNTLSDRYTEL